MQCQYRSRNIHCPMRGGDIVNEQKYCFTCSQCGKRDIFQSQLTITAGYGSKYDGEQYTLFLCGDCVDWIIDSMKESGIRYTKEEHL